MDRTTDVLRGGTRRKTCVPDERHKEDGVRLHSVPSYTRLTALNVSVLASLTFQLHVKLLLVYRSFIFELKRI
jgi:hypothetical protein